MFTVTSSLSTFAEQIESARQLTLHSAVASAVARVLTKEQFAFCKKYVFYLRDADCRGEVKSFSFLRGEMKVTGTRSHTAAATAPVSGTLWHLQLDDTSSVGRQPLTQTQREKKKETEKVILSSRYTCY